MGSEMPGPALILSLRCSAQTYDWGVPGAHRSAVARLFERNRGGQPIDPDTPYAEFWMGTHDSGPSFLLDGDGDQSATTLKSWVKDNPGVLGDKVVAHWGTDIPFLFKVLSVAKALSIQAHPDKELATTLNKTHPQIYKDPNHKPEMAIAITEFRALCGFVSTKELNHVLSIVPEIKELVGLEDARKSVNTKDLDTKTSCEIIMDTKELIVENTTKVVDIKEQDGYIAGKAVLQSFFTKLMSADKDTVSVLVSKMKRRLEQESKTRVLNEKEELALHLEKQYPDDIGVLSSFFFNYIKLNPGEALYIGANEPHAYISGECIECMATSDNVVRAGLTPKFRDVQTLCSMLTYKQAFPEVLKGTPLNPYISQYTPPFDEFEVDRCLLPPGESAMLSAVRGPSLIVVMAGGGSMHADLPTGDVEIKEGNVFFVPANTEIKVGAGAAEKLQMYRARVNNKFFA